VSDDAAFREVQRFRQDWLWALLIVGSVPAAVLATTAIVAEDGLTGSLPTLLIVQALVFGPLVAFHRAALVTEVRNDGLYLKLFPLHLSARRVPCEAIERIEAREVDAFGEFGGVGIRYGFTLSRRGLAVDGPKGYVVQGGDAVELQRREARPLVVTTRRPTELVAAIERCCRG
jgi:hypothetical protein